MFFLSRLTVFLALMTSVACADSLSGTYVGRGENSISLVQLVETNGGQLAGHFQYFEMQADGKMNVGNATLNGVRDGETVVVTMKSAQFLSGGVPMSGTWQGGVLRLAGGGDRSSFALSLVRSDEAEFQAQVAALTRRAEQISEARNRKEIIVRINELAQRMNTFAKENDGTLGAFAHARSIHGDDQASVPRMQIYLAINQAAIEADQIHMAVQTASDRFNAQVNTLNQDHNALNQSCKTARPVTLGVSQHDELSAARQAMTERAKRFESSVARREALSLIWKKYGALSARNKKKSTEPPTRPAEQPLLKSAA